jgi:acyl-CoA thioester hydrolase
MRETDEFAPEPIRTATRRVPPEWIDYNGHMNVAYYTLAFDKAMDEVLERLGVGPSFVAEAGMGPMALVTQIHYLAELVEGEEFACDYQLLDADAKRIHSFLTMVRTATGEAAATYETLTVNVDLAARRSAPYPDWAQRRIGRLLEAHAGLPRPPQTGARIGIRRKG